MSTSGITSYALTRDDLITAALRKLGVIADGQSPSATNITNAAQAANTLIAEFRTYGMELWERREYSFNPVASQQTYQMGTGYTLNTAYPLKLLQAYRLDNSNTTKIPIEIVSNYNFNLYPANSGGLPIQLTYQPLVNYGEIKLWPIPDSTATTSTVTVIYQRPFEYFNASTDTCDFPEEWYNAFIYKLAVLLAPEWGIPLPDRQMLRQEAEEYLEHAISFGTEDGSFFIQPWRLGSKY